MKLNKKLIDGTIAQKKDLILVDGNGLSLKISTTGVKSWILFYRFNIKQYRTRLGQYPEYSLQQAREWMFDCKNLLKNKITPQELKDDFNSTKYTSFQKGIIKEYLKKWLPFKSINLIEDSIILKDLIEDWLKYVLPLKLKDVYEVERCVRKDIIPRLGHLPVNKITVQDINKLTDEIKSRGSSFIALRTFAILNRILKYAISRGEIQINPAYSIDSRLIGRVNHRNRALSPNEIGILFRDIYKSSINRKYKLALHLLMLSMVRKSELRFAQWSEVDFDKAEWLIASERMKMKRDHIVYLSSQAIRILRELQDLALGSNFVMPSKDNINVPLGSSTFTHIIELIKPPIEHFVIHDFRRTASTILHENEFTSDWIEKCLAHEQKGVRGVYNKAQYADGRRKMLQWWADFIDQQIGNYI